MFTCFSAKRFCDRLVIYTMGLDTRKPIFGICEQQRRRPNCAVRSAPLLFAYWKVSYLDLLRLCYLLIGKYHIWTCYKRIFNFLASLCSWGDWFEPGNVRKPQRQVLSHRGPYDYNVYNWINMKFTCECRVLSLILFPSSSTLAT